MVSFVLNETVIIFKSNLPPAIHVAFKMNYSNVINVYIFQDIK